MYNSPFLESIRYILRTKHYSIQTEKAYLHWIKHFIIFNQKRHPKDMGEEEVSNYLTYLAVWRSAKIKGINQALSNEYLANAGLLSLREIWVKIHHG